MEEKREKGILAIRYDGEVKKRIVHRYFKEKVSIRSLAKELSAEPETIRQWIIKYKAEVLRLYFDNDINLTRMKTKSDSTKLSGEVKRLEQELKMANLQVEGYQIMIDILREEYGIDVVKKYGAKQLNNSKTDTTK